MSTPPAEPGFSLRHPALWVTAVSATACVLITASYRVYDTDFWQHLVVGKALWQAGKIPATQQWSWPTYGAPDVNPSWGFSAVLWPLWSSLGVAGLFVMRWVTMLVAFGLLWAAARRMGARGLAPLAVIVAGALLFLDGSPIGPKLVVAVLLAAQIAILEARRQGGRDLSLWLIPIAWVWANVHVTWFLGFVVLGAYLLHDLLARRTHGFEKTLAPDRRRLWLAAGAAALISFANPFGWRALWQAADLVTRAQEDASLRAAAVPSPFSWPPNARTAIALSMIGWPVLLLWRWRRTGLDVAETALYVAFTALALAAQRLSGFYVLVAVPFVARDLESLARTVRWPAWTASPMNRAAGIGALCVAMGALAWTRADRPIGWALDMKRYPERAADWIEKHDVRGRMFNHFPQGGYLAYRFWPDRERLPFMDVERAGTLQDRQWYSRVFTDPQGWSVMDDTYHFESVLLDASQPREETDWLKDVGSPGTELEFAL